MSSFSSQSDSIDNGPLSPQSSKLGQERGIASPASIDRSVVAVHGSVATRLHATLKDSKSYFFPAPNSGHGQEDWDNNAAKEMPGDKIDEEEPANDAPLIPNGRVIGIDFDDVICEWIPVLVKEFNTVFGAELTL